MVCIVNIIIADYYIDQTENRQQFYQFVSFQSVHNNTKHDIFYFPLNHFLLRFIFRKSNVVSTKA